MQILSEVIKRKTVARIILMTTAIPAPNIECNIFRFPTQFLLCYQNLKEMVPLLKILTVFPSKSLLRTLFTPPLLSGLCPNVTILGRPLLTTLCKIVTPTHVFYSPQILLFSTLTQSPCNMFVCLLSISQNTSSMKEETIFIPFCLPNSSTRPGT